MISNAKKILDRAYLLSPAIVFVVSFLVRFCLISKGPYHVDSLNLVLQAQKTLETHQLQFAFGSGYPLNVLLAAVFIGVSEFFGCHDSVWAVNLASVFFGALGTVVFYLFLRLIFDEKAAWLGAGLFCFNPILWGTSVYGMNHMPSLFFQITGLYFLFRYFKHNVWGDFLWGAVFIGFMGATRLQDMVLIVPAIIYSTVFLNEGGILKKLRRTFWFFLIVGAIVAVFHLPYMFNDQESGYSKQLQLYGRLGFVQFDGRMFLLLGNGWAHLLESFSWFGCVLAAAGMVLILRKRTLFAVFLLLWFLVPLLCLSSMSGLPPRFLIMVVPVIVLLLSYVFSQYMNGPRFLKWAAMTVWVSLIIYSVVLMYPILNFRHHRAEIVTASQWFGRITPSNSVIFARDEGFFITHYGGRQVMEGPACWGGCSNAQFLDFKSKVRELTSQGRAVYITSMGLQADDPDGEFQKFVKGNFDLIPVGKSWTEDWHHDCMVLRLGWVKLFKIVAIVP